MKKDLSYLYPYQPCPKCGSTNLGFGSGIDIIDFLRNNNPKDALKYTYTICNDCNYKLTTWQTKTSDNHYYIRNVLEWNGLPKQEKQLMFNFFRNKTNAEKDDLNKKGKCFLCPNETEDEELYNLFGVEVCEGCYHELINYMGYKNIDDLLECDKKQLNKFLNKLAILKNNY